MVTARGGITCFKSIIHIINMADSSVCRLIAPVIDYIIGEIRSFGTDYLTSEISWNVVYYQIVVKGQIASSHHKSEAVNALNVSAPRICRTYNRILHCIMIVVWIKSPLLICSPAHRAMIYYWVWAFSTAPCIIAWACGLVGTGTWA